MEHNKATAEKEQCTYATMQVRLTFQFVVVPPLPIAHASAFLCTVVVRRGGGGGGSGVFLGPGSFLCFVFLEPSLEVCFVVLGENKEKKARSMSVLCVGLCCAVAKALVVSDGPVTFDGSASCSTKRFVFPPTPSRCIRRAFQRSCCPCRKNSERKKKSEKKRA